MASSSGPSALADDGVVPFDITNSSHRFGLLPVEVFDRLLRLRNPDRRYQSQLFAELDRRTGDVDLPPLEAVDRGPGKGVMCVVPRFAEGRDGQGEVVGAVIADRIGPAAEEVADGVDAPDDVVTDQDPDGAAPEEPLHGPQPAPRPEPLDSRWQQQSHAQPDEVVAVQP